MSSVTTDSQNLACIRPGQSCTVCSVDGDDDISRRLIDLGFVPGTEVEVVRRAPLGDPIAFRFRDTTMCLRRDQARRIHVA